eukprot:886192-Amphidinium_carterae.1
MAGAQTAARALQSSLMYTHRCRVSCPVSDVRAVHDVGGSVSVGENSTSHLTHVVYVVKSEEGADLEAL